MTEFYTVPEIAEILRISRPTAYKLLASGELPCVHFGKVKRIPKDDFDLWVKTKIEDQQGEVQNRKAIPLARLNR